MATKKRDKRKGKSRGKKRAAVARRRKSRYIRAGQPGHVRRGCGKGNWRRGGNAKWKCRVGKKFYYKPKRKKPGRK